MERKPLVFEGSKREFYEQDGKIYCDRRGCPGSAGLRDHRNGVPICAKCAVRTAVGYISKDTAREHENIFFNATATDYVIAGVVAFVVSLVAGFVIMQLGFFYFSILLAAPAGGVVSEAVYRISRKRRGRYTGQVVGAAMVLSVIVLLLFALIGIGSLLSLGIYAFIAIGVAVSRFQLGLRL